MPPLQQCTFVLCISQRGILTVLLLYLYPPLYLGAAGKFLLSQL